VSALQRVEAGLRAAVSSPEQSGTADRLCEACVELLDVDGAALSVWLDGDARGTFGASSALSRRLDDLQFTYGEGPCVDAVSSDARVLIDNLDGAAQARWPGFTQAALDVGVAAVFALPVRITSLPFGALDLFRSRPGGLSPDALSGGLRAAEFAALPLLDLMAAAVDRNMGEDGDTSQELASLDRVEVHQAVGMIMGQLDLGPDDAMARLRAYAFATGSTATEVARNIVARRLVLDDREH
jgi:hypothetical protein